MTDAATASQYCERVSGGFWAEPANALTNAAFLVAAAFAVALILRRRGRGAVGWDLWLLVVLMGCIGVGSFLWHTLAVAWAEAADVVPILLFVSLFLAAYLVRVAGLSVGWALLWLAVFELFNFGVPIVLPAGLLNGSIGYLPTWLGMLILAVYGLRRAPAQGRTLLVGVAVFTVSLALRSIDQAICPVFPLGTHFGWHLLNGLVLYLAFRALIEPLPSPNRRGGWPPFSVPPGE